LFFFSVDDYLFEGEEELHFFFVDFCFHDVFKEDQLVQLLSESELVQEDLCLCLDFKRCFVLDDLFGLLDRALADTSGHLVSLLLHLRKCFVEFGLFIVVLNFFHLVDLQTRYEAPSNLLNFDSRIDYNVFHFLSFLV